MLATDGVYEHLSARRIAKAINEGGADLDSAARAIVDQAFEAGSEDNLTVQIVRADQLPESSASEVFGQPSQLPLPPLLEARMVFDGYRIVRELHGSSRSHIYLAVDIETDSVVTLKIPSIDLRDDPAYLKRFLMEEWVARRIDSPHVLKPCLPSRKRNFLYVVTEYIDGQTLTQWMIDNPNPSLETVRDIVEQIAKGLRAFHRKEMLHQDLRPDNIMIDATGTVKIIDFGSTRIKGVAEAEPPACATISSAPLSTPRRNIFWARAATSRSDLFSLGVIAYQMLTGRLPYGAQAAQARTRAQFGRLQYRPAALVHEKFRLGSTARWSSAVHPDP